MNKNKSTSKIRIKDIAEKAGTSIGSVDRVLHGRPNVSEEVRKRVEQALKELDYEPNRYASALASNKDYRFVAFIPSPELEPYWGEVSQGLQDAIQNYRDFNLSLEELYYNIFSPESYNKGLKEILDRQPDGVILAPQLSAITYNFCQHLKENNIPFTFLDSNIHDLDALTFYGQDSLMSGRFAARMSVLEAAPEKEFLIVHFDIPSLQQYNREVGFREFIHKNHPGSVIHELSISPKDPNAHEVLNDFREKHPEVHFVCTFCSHTRRGPVYSGKGHHGLAHDGIRHARPEREFPETGHHPLPDCATSLATRLRLCGCTVSPHRAEEGNQAHELHAD